MFQNLTAFYNRYSWFFRGLFKVFSTIFHILWKTLWIVYKIFITLYHFLLKFLSFLD